MEALASLRCASDQPGGGPHIHHPDTDPGLAVIREGDAPWYLRLGAWIGMGTAPGALAAGAGIATFLTADEMLVAVPVGVLILTSLACAQGIKGRRERATLVELARITLGEAWGPRVMAVMVFLGVAGWVGFYMGLASGSLTRLLAWPGWAGAVIFAVVVWMIHKSGRSVWDVFVALTGAAALGVSVLVFTGVPIRHVAGSVSGFRPTALVAGVGAVVSYAAVFSVRAPDFTWDVRRDSDVWRAGLAMAITSLAFIGLGAGIYMRVGAWDLADLANSTRYPGAAVFLLVLASVAPAVTGLHSGGLAIEFLTGSTLGRGAAAVAALGVVLGMTRFDLRLLTFLGVLGMVIPPVLTTMLIQRRRQPSRHAWISWLAGSGAALLAFWAGWTWPVLLGMAVSALVMAVFSLLGRRLQTPVS